MRKKILFLALSFASTIAFAQPFSLSNFYLAGFGGANFINSHEEENCRADLNTGYIVGGSLGYKFSRFFRLEGEAAYRSNTLDQFVIGNMQISASGDYEIVAAMANGIINIPLLGTSLIPYFGAGLGKRWEKIEFVLEPIVTEEGTFFFDKFLARDQGFAYQGIVGFFFCTGQIAQAGLEYRYLNGSHIDANHAVDLNLRIYL